MTASLPRNKLEELLLSAREGAIGKEDFVQAMLESQIYMLMDRPADDLLAQGDPRALLVTDGNNAEQMMLAIFSEESRAREYLQSEPLEETYYPTPIEAPWAFLTLPKGSGAVFNPNCDLNYRFSPDVAAKLRDFYAEQVHL